MGRTVELRVAGQNYRVVSSASAEQLEHLAAIVNRKMGEVAPQARGDGAQRLLLVAMALAHDVEEERAQRAALRIRTLEFLAGLLGRVDAALAGAASECSGEEQLQKRSAAHNTQGKAAGGADEGEDRFT